MDRCAGRRLAEWLQGEASRPSAKRTTVAEASPVITATMPLPSPTEHEASEPAPIDETRVMALRTDIYKSIICAGQLAKMFSLNVNKSTPTSAPNSSS